MSDEHLAEAPRPVHTQDAAARAPRGGSVRPLLAVLAYFAVYLVLRLVEQGGLERDEAEMVYLARDLRLGYGVQPPLYTWLQWLAFQAFGVDRFALAIVKALSLAAMYLAMYRAARPLAGRQGALVAAASLLLFPQIGLEALRIQTHSVLMMALACALLWAYVALLARPDRARYALFGLVASLGMLAKYNFGILLAGVVGASLLVPEHRRVLWKRRAWGGPLAAIVVGLLVLLPHAAWIVQHPDAAFAGTLHKLQDGTGRASYPWRVLQGALSLASGLAGFVALPALVFAALCWPVRKRPAIDTRPPAARFFLWLYGICLLQLAVLVFMGRVGLIKERWLMPVLFSLPLAAVVLVPGLRRPEVGRKLVRVAGAAALLLLALMPARTWLGPAFGKTVAAHYPYAPLAETLQRRHPAVRTVLTDDVMLAGNLRFLRPGLHPLLHEDALRGHRQLAGQVLLVTQEDGNEAALAQAFRAAYPQARLVSAERLALPMRLGGKGVMVFSDQCFEVPARPEPQGAP